MRLQTDKKTSFAECLIRAKPFILSSYIFGKGCAGIHQNQAPTLESWD
jgi:hypothetical protein